MAPVTGTTGYQTQTQRRVVNSTVSRIIVEPAAEQGKGNSVVDQYTFAGGMAHTSSNLVYTATEILERIIDLCDWDALVALGVSTFKLRSIRDLIICRRIKTFLSFFISEDDHERFFTELNVTKGAVFGGVVRCIMSSGNPDYYSVFPEVLFIAVPFHSKGRYAGAWRRFLASIGYKILYDDFPMAHEGTTVRRVIQTKQVKTAMKINVVESAKPSLLPVVLSFGHTAECNLLTARHIYCLYPQMMSCHENLRIRIDEEIVAPTELVAPFLYGLLSHSDTSQWGFMGRPCGMQCAAVWRDSHTLTGASVVPVTYCKKYSQICCSETPEREISEGRVRWTIGTVVCTNSMCEYQGRGSRTI